MGFNTGTRQKEQKDTPAQCQRVHLLWTCYGLQQVRSRGKMSQGNGSLRDGGCFKWGIVDVRFAYFPLLLLRGTVPFQLWWSSLLSVCLAEWFHMEEHISTASGAAERWDKQVWEQDTCVHSNKPLLQWSPGVSSEIYNRWVPGSCFTCLDALRTLQSIFPKIIFWCVGDILASNTCWLTAKYIWKMLCRF